MPRVAAAGLLLIALRWVAPGYGGGGGLARAQTCCSGGVPVSANLGLPASERGVVQLSLAADANRLRQLRTGGERVDDRSRSRTTNAVLAEVGYAFTDRLALDVFASFVQQRRRIGRRAGGGDDLDVTAGLGDVVALGKYRLVAAPTRQLSLGAGVKLPTGAADLADDRGLAFNADLQPGSGAVDAIAWANYTQSLPRRPAASLVFAGVFSRKGANDRYLGDSRYRFGDELQLALGYAERVSVGGYVVDLALDARYRRAAPDRFDGGVQPSTGGDFAVLRPGVTAWLSPAANVFASGELPIVTRVVGTQLAPSWRINVGAFVRLPTRRGADPSPSPSLTPPPS